MDNKHRLVLEEYVKIHHKILQLTERGMGTPDDDEYLDIIEEIDRLGDRRYKLLEDYDGDVSALIESIKRELGPFLRDTITD